MHAIVMADAVGTHAANSMCVHGILCHVHSMCGACGCACGIGVLNEILAVFTWTWCVIVSRALSRVSCKHTTNVHVGQGPRPMFGMHHWLFPPVFGLSLRIQGQAPAHIR